MFYKGSREFLLRDSDLREIETVIMYCSKVGERKRKRERWREGVRDYDHVKRPVASTKLANTLSSLGLVRRGETWRGPKISAAMQAVWSGWRWGSQAGHSRM